MILLLRGRPRGSCGFLLPNRSESAITNAMPSGRSDHSNSILNVRAAERAHVSALKQPRVLAGVLLVLGAALIGGLLWNATTDTDDYWVLAHDVVAGTPVTQADLSVSSAAIPDGAAVVRAVESVPEGAVWGADHGARAFVSPQSWATEFATRLEVPIRVQAGDSPVDLAAGDHVDVWITGEDGAASLVLSSVRVADVGRSAASSEETVLVSLAESPSPEVVGRLAAGRALIVRRS